MNEILINNHNVLVKEYEGKRVITFKDIDAVHNRPEGTARRNFNTNKKHFIEGEDYFVRNSYEAKKILQNFQITNLRIRQYTAKSVQQIPRGDFEIKKFPSLEGEESLI